MTGFDPSALQDIQPPDIVGGIAKGFQLKDMVDSQQLSQLKLGQEKATLADAAKAKGIMTGSDLSTDKGVAETAEKLTKAGLPKEAMDLRKQSAAVKSGELDNQLKNVELHTAAQDIISGSVDKIWAQAKAMKDAKTPDGRPKYSDASIDAWIQGQIPLTVSSVQSDSGLPDPVKKAALGGMNQFLSQSGGKITFDQLTQVEQSSKAGAARLKAHRDELAAQTGARKADVAEAGEAERERHDRAMEAKGAGAPTGSKSNALLAALADRGATLPQGMRSKSQQDAILNGLIARHPDMTVDQIADGVARGSLSMATEKTESGVLGRREAAILPVEKSITKPGGFLDQAEAAVNKVDFSKLKAAGAFESWTKDQNSDPALTAYKAAVAELRAEYSIVLSKGGQVTDAARHEAEKVIPDLITKEQFKSIKNTVRQGIEASKSGVEESIEGVTGGKDKGPSAGGKVLKFDAQGNPVT